MKKVIACVIVCCILLCLFAACGKKETYKNIYISKDICPTKDEVIKNDEEHEIISVEDGEINGYALLHLKLGINIIMKQ